MKKTLIATIVLAIGLLPVTANAAIISVTGPLSSAGTAPAIIPAPANALNSVAFNSGMEGFDEVQVVTTVAHTVDGGGVIASGTWVSSHMIFLNREDGIGGTNLSHGPVVWTFDGPVVGVMSDGGGNREALSTFELGAPGTNYTVGIPSQVAPYPARGMEGGDSYLVAGNQITVDMVVSQPGDWIRVVTLAPIEVEIDIKPGSDPNPINPSSKGLVPVAILSSPEFDATQVDPTSVSLAGAGVAVRGKGKSMAHEEDVNGDGLVDLLVQVETQDFEDLGEGGTVELTGITFGGENIVGYDEVVIVPPDK